MQARQVLSAPAAKAASARKIRPGCLAFADREIIGGEFGRFSLAWPTSLSAPKVFLSKNVRARKAVPLLEIAIVILIEVLRLDAEINEQLLGLRAVKFRASDRLRAAVADDRAPAGVEFVATRVAAKIVVVFEDQDLGCWDRAIWRKKYAAESPLMPPPTTIRS